MIEKLSWIAELAATSASRRQFLGRVGKGALAAAGVLASYVAFGSEARAARRCSTDANCPRGYICVAGKCIKGVRTQACGAGSQTYCQGSVEGAYCQIGTTAGICVGAPACTCVPVRGPRGGRR